MRTGRALRSWMWYPGDYELYHALKQNFSRVERGMGWPAFWKSEGFRQRIVLWREYELDAPTQFTVYAHGVGFVRVNQEKHPFGQPVSCGPGKVTIVIHVGRIEALPCALVEGDAIQSGPGWMAEDYNVPAVEAGFDPRYCRPAQDPAVWEYSAQPYDPIRVEAVRDGFLYEWETELTAALEIKAPAERLSEMMVYCGESREEALGGDQCYLRWTPEYDPSDKVGRCPRCALRFVFIPGERLEVRAVHQFVDIPVRAEFTCDDPRLNKIWQVAEHTFRLCTGIFFLDGVKRDQWIWSGDAYQSIFVNRYLLADPGVEQRTLTALRGNDPMTGHINTIVDYSLLWVMGIKAHYETVRDLVYLRRIYPKMVSLMEFCRKRCDENGFLVGRDKDWTFIDWAELDKDGPFGGEQMLYYASLNIMAWVGELLGDDGAAEQYRTQAQALLNQIRKFFWLPERGAYIDSFTSGRKFVSRQTNLLAIRCGVADAEQVRAIAANVLENDAVSPIKTPYFQFFALDVLGKLGRLEAVMDQLRGYWGGMLERGAVTFWEEFDPSVTGREQYDMYGDAFGKSLCHAWAASPIYLIARWFVGLELTDGPEGDFVLTPRLEFFRQLNCTLPVGAKGGSVHICWDGAVLTVEANRTCGSLRIGGKTLNVSEGRAVAAQIK